MASDIAVLVKVVPTQVEVDPLTGSPSIDTRFLGVSAADRAALAVAFELAREIDCDVDLYCVAPPGAEAALLELAATGVARTVRLALRGDEGLAPARWLSAYPSALVARVLASVVARPQFVLAGDHSLDRGSGSVPARVAERLGYAQALGLLEVDASTRRAVRRLDGGWREEVAFAPGTVLSVEASAGKLGRVGLGALRQVEIETYDVDEQVARPDSQFAPYRPPVAVVAPPLEPLASRRAMEVIGANAPTKRREIVEADPDRAAELIMERLAAWGYQ